MFVFEYMNYHGMVIVVFPDHTHLLFFTSKSLNNVEENKRM